MRRHPVSLFVDKYPAVCPYTLIQVAEEINRITKAGIGWEGIIINALDKDEAEQYLTKVCLHLQKSS